MRIRKLILVELVTLCCSYPLTAQEPELKKNSLQEGMWALQFQISQNFTLTSFQGSTISLKRQYSPNAAIRLGTTVNISSSTSEAEPTNAPDTGNYTWQSRSGFANSQGISIAVQYLRYPDPIAGINLYFGGGPLVIFGRSKDARESIIINTNSPPIRYQNTDETTNLSTGISLVAGLEWFASTSISITAEYYSTLQYDWSKTTHTLEPPNPGSDSEGKDSRFGFRPSTVRFGISGYF